MALDPVFTFVLAVAVPLWLVIEQALVRRRSARRDRVQMTSGAREKSVLRPAVRLS
jgi:hypothetical protein